MENSRYKFRAWLPKRKMMVDVTGINFGNEITRDYLSVAWVKEIIKNTGSMEINYEHSDPYEDVVLLQFTGLKDCNGVEIYEGDIVKEIVNTPTGSPYFVVEYVECEGAFMFRNQFNDYDLFSYMDKIEVIGNVYENPELLGRKEK